MGSAKPSTDLLKAVKAAKLAINEGLLTRQQATRDLFGGNYPKNVKILLKENESLSKANEPISVDEIEEPDDSNSGEQTNEQ